MAATSALRFQAGDTLIIGSDCGNRQMLTVVKRRREGYHLRTADDPDGRTWSHDEIYDHYVSGNLEHFQCNLQALDATLSDVLQADWEVWRPDLRFAAECREQYCLYVAELQRRGVKSMPAYARAARTVFRKNRAPWNARANQLAGVAAKLREDRRRKGRATLLDPAIIELSQPSQYTVRSWYQRWESSGRNIRSLIPQFHARGDRTPRKTSKVHLQIDDSRPLCVYGAMKHIARSVYMKIPRVSKMYAYRELIKLCKRDGFETVSHTTFFTFLDKHFTDFEEYRARHGWKAAFYKFHLFARREAPERPLEEVEVDHTLLDVFVRDVRGRVGRPWLTLLICRATRCVVGLHIGFDVPSYATLQRAVVHAICPKDLRGLPEIENDWPCHGVMDSIITDRGLEFLSESFLFAGRHVGFAVVNLPGRCPYLKGVVERFFGTLNVRVLSHLEGSTQSRTDEIYDPQIEARFSLPELTLKIVKWIVDEYHQETHGVIGCSPAERWRRQTDLFGVRPMTSFRHVITLLGETVRRKVQNTGIHWEGHTYRSLELEQLRMRRGGRKKDWVIRCDPYDRGEVWVLDDLRRRWIAVPAVHQETARGVSKYQARIQLRVARQLAGPGVFLTDELMSDAKRIADEQAERGSSRRVMRYLADGALATAVSGVDIAVVLTPANDADVPLLSDEATARVDTMAKEQYGEDNTAVPPAESAPVQDLAWAELVKARLEMAA